jgi:UDP-2,4-diacetamido-2,4,6-trideoxy-beta-L-altropyranose hydrolase
LHIAFRVDASSQIGTGHFMRCLTLADVLHTHGARIRFVSRHMPDHLSRMLADRAHELRLLGGARHDDGSGDLLHSHWLGASQNTDATETNEQLADRDWDWLVVDHYALDSRWESAFDDTAARVLVIDDVADRRHECDVLLDQTLHGTMHSRYAGKVPANCEMLLGPRYALIRKEFCDRRDAVGDRTGPIRRILVFFGGIDAENHTSLAIEAIATLDTPGLQVDVVIGAQHPCRSQIEAECARHAFACHVQTDRMASLMAAADLAIGAVGSASWERCCLGLPTISVTTGLNQIAVAEGLLECGAIVMAGTGSSVTAAGLAEALVSLIQRPERLLAMSRSARSLVDGLGAPRVCDRMISLA